MCGDGCTAVLCWSCSRARLTHGLHQLRSPVGCSLPYLAPSLSAWFSVAAGWYLKYLRQHWKEVAAGVVLFCLSMGFLLGVVAYGDLAASYIVSAFSDSGDGWVCVERGRTMYFPLSDSGELGAAEKGCTCAEIANFQC